MSDDDQTRVAHHTAINIQGQMTGLRKRFEGAERRLSEKGGEAALITLGRARDAFFQSEYLKEPLSQIPIGQFRTGLTLVQNLIDKVFLLNNLEANLSSNLVVTRNWAASEYRTAEVFEAVCNLKANIMAQDGVSAEIISDWQQREAACSAALSDLEGSVGRETLERMNPLASESFTRLLDIRSMIANKRAEHLVAEARKTLNDAEGVVSDGPCVELLAQLGRYEYALNKLLDDAFDGSVKLSDDNRVAVIDKVEACRQKMEDLVSRNSPSRDIERLIASVESRFEVYHLSTQERNKLQYFLETDSLICEDYSKKGRYLENLKSALEALEAQLAFISGMAHLQVSEKQSLSQWCSRLSQHSRSLNAATTDLVENFSPTVMRTLKAIANGSPVLVNNLVSAVHDPACSDWGSKILIDMQAHILSDSLSDLLLRHLSSSSQSAPVARMQQLEQFIETHQKDFCALLNYAAFQSATNDKTIIDPSDEESLEAYLFLYLEAKETYPLPGQFSADRMDNAEYVITNASGRGESLAEKRRAISAVLQGAQGDLKAHYLDQLSDPFNLKIWENVVAAMPNNAVREAAATAERAKLFAEMTALDEARGSGKLDLEDYEAKSKALKDRFDVVGRCTESLHKDYLERLIVLIKNPV